MRSAAVLALLAFAACADSGTAYQCEDGRQAVARFYKPDRMALMLDGKRSDLVQVRAASGVKYADSSTVFWTRGSTDAMLETPGVMTRCVAQR